MDSELDRALRYRNYAEELRLIAADRTSPEIRQTLTRIADEYDRMAASVEAMEHSKAVRLSTP